MSKMSRRLCALSAALAASFVLVACGGGGGSSPTLTATADSAGTTAGGSAVTLHATSSQDGAQVTWLLEGGGQLSATTGASVQYLPPSTDLLDDDTSVKVTAFASGAMSTVELQVAAAHLPGRHWTAARESSVDWRGVVNANGLFVAYGDYGRLATSADSRTWTRHDPVFLQQGAPFPDWIAGVGFAGTQWLALGFNGFADTSRDGATWTAATPVPNAGGAGISGLAAGNGRFVALASDATYVSTDGLQWTKGDHAVHSAVFGNGVFVGEDGSQLLLSTDGLSWHRVHAFSAPPQSGVYAPYLAFANGLFGAYDASGSLLTSPDGTTWTSRAAPGLQSLQGTPDAFFGVAFDTGTSAYELYDSGTGAQWDAFWPDNAVDAYSAIGGDANSWVRLSHMGSIERNDRNSGPWETVADGGVGMLQAVDDVAGVIVALSEHGYALRSTNHGLTWSSVYASPYGAPGDRFDGLALAHFGLTTVAVGSAVTSTGAGGRITTSADGGGTWSIAADVARALRAVTSDGERFIAVGDAGTA
ncbi:MAG TPA: hypothetical protein VIP05_32035, partial [Burkholderiaceae bacterium]